MRHPFTSTKCQIRDVTVHLYAKKSRKKKCPSAVDKALEKVNVAMDEEDKKQTFTALQSKEAKLPFLYTDSVDKYWNDLRRERKGGVPCNVLVAYSGMTREMCVEFLEKMDPGAYIVRSSISVENTFVFSFRNQTGIKHWQLSDREGKYYWGSSSGFHTLESFVEHFAEALSQVTHLHVYPGMTTALTPQFHTTEQQSMIGRLRAMDDRLGYGQLCRVIKDVNSEIRQGKKESIGRKPVPRKVKFRSARARYCACANVPGRRARMRNSPPTQTHAQPAIVTLFSPFSPRKPSFWLHKMSGVEMSEEHQSAVEEKMAAEQKRKRRSYDVAFKMEVVAYAQAHNKMKAARQFDIHRRCVQTWCKTRDKLEAANAKRMRLAEHEEAPAEALEVSISGITEEGELLAALPITCASIVDNNDVTSDADAVTIAALVAAAAVKFYKFLGSLIFDCPFLER
jgi:transposase-like protein